MASHPDHEVEVHPLTATEELEGGDNVAASMQPPQRRRYSTDQHVIAVETPIDPQVWMEDSYMADWGHRGNLDYSEV